MPPELDHLTNPYIGPRAFQYGEQIYGREHETGKLVNLIVAERIVLLYSPSGAGKTSLIQAALIPRMAKMKFQVLPVVRISQASPETFDGNGSVNRYVFSTLLSLEEGLPETQQIEQDRLKSMSLAEYLAQRPRDGASRDIDVLIFDQFEEILSLNPTDQEAKREFFRQVGEALTVPNRWALFSMREDFIAALDPYLLSIPNRFSTTFRLDLLGVDAAHQAIQEPARESGVEFEDSAVDKLVDDLRRVRVQRHDGSLEPQLGLYIEPVQLQVVCHRVWRKLDLSSRRITEADLANFGVVNQSLVDESLAEYYAQRVDATAAQTGTSERSIREWFDRHLITEQGIRGNVLMSPGGSGGLDNRAIQALIDAHLVRAEKRGGATWFELAHDRLIGPVRADNSAWLKTNLSLLQKQSGLWDQNGRPDGLLLHGKDLVEAERWAAKHPEELLPVEVEFLKVCKLHSERERRTRRLTRLIAILGIIAIILALFAYRANLNAQRQARAAFTGELAAHANALLDSSPVLSMLLAIEANTVPRRGEQHPAAVEASLRAALTEPHGRPLPGHTSQVNAVAFSPDGRWLATGSGDKTARLWDMNTDGVQGDPLILSGHEDSVKALAFSPDGHWLATGSADKTARLWDLEAADPSASRIVLAQHRGEINTLAFSPDGRWLATGSQDGSTLLWDLHAPDPAERPRGIDVPEGWIESLAFSPQGRWLAMGGPHSVWLADLSSPDPVIVRQLPGHNLLVQSMAFSPDGRWLATGSRDRSARLWDLSSPDPAASPYVLLSHGDWVNSLAFSPDGHWLATGSGDKTAMLWNMTGADPSANPIVLPGHRSAIKTLAFSPDGRWLATGSMDHTIRLWEIKDAAPSLNPLVLSGHEDWVNSLAFSPDGRWLSTGSQDGSIRIWNLANTAADTNPIVLHGHQDQINNLAFSPNGSWLATGSADQTTHLWNINLSDPNAYPLKLDGHNSWIQVLAFSPDGHWLATGSGDNTAKLSDVGSMDPFTQAVLRLKFAGSTKTLAGHKGEIRALAVSPDGQWLATGSADHTARLWEIDSADPSGSAKILAGHEGEINSVAFSPDGRWLATGSADNTARLWDLRAVDPGASFIQLKGHRDNILALAFSPDGRWLATASGDRTTRLWDLKAVNPAANPVELPGHEDQVATLAFSPDGRWLATGSWDHTARLWDMKAANIAAHSIKLEGHEDWITSLAFSPDGRWLATGSRDSTAQLWDLTTPTLPGGPIELSGHTDAITTLAFSPDGRWLATGSVDRTSRLWLVQFDELAALACRSTGRNLSQAEWQAYFPGERYHKTCPQWPDGN